MAIRLLFILPLLICASYAIQHNINNLLLNDHSSESAYAEIVTELEFRHVEKGYADFYSANTITVISNDTIHIRPLNNMTELYGSHWLSNKTWYPPYADNQQPVVYICSFLTTEEFQKTAKQRNIQITDVVVIGDYTLFYTDKDYSVWQD